MAKKILRRRGTTAQHAIFTGGDGEITIDTTKKVIVVHDNATPGGFPAARESAVQAVQTQVDTLNNNASLAALHALASSF